MALPDFDAGVGHSFGLEFDSVVIKQIQEITGLKKEQDVIEMKSNTNDGKYMIKKLPGRWKAGEVTLTRGLTSDNSFEQWIKNSELGNMSAARKGGDHRVRLHGRSDQALQAGERVAQVARDRQPEGRRHDRSDRKARAHLRADGGRRFMRAPSAVEVAGRASRPARAAP